MFTDGNEVPAGTELTCDVCIVGTGPAGLAIADELRGRGLRITMLERGGLHAAAPAADLDFESPHFASPVDTRCSQFGGMAPSWGSTMFDGSTAARYLPLDPIDFKERHWVPHSGWPITLDDLEPYYARARERCGVAPFDFRDDGPVRGPRAVLSTPSGMLLTRFDQLGPAAVFTDDASLALRVADDVEVLTEVTALTLAPAGVSVVISARSAAGSMFTVHARAVVVAAGAIDTARLLLASSSQHPAGLGNQHDNVGRFFMDHPRVSLGYGALSGKVPTSAMGAYEPHEVGAHFVIGKVKLTEDALHRERLLNGNAQLFPHLLSIEQWASVRSARRVASSVRARRELLGVPRDVVIASRTAPSTAWAMYRMRHQDKADVPRSGSDRWTTVRARSFKLTYQPEQAPSRSNRVTLGDRLDAYGQRIPKLWWRWSEIDLVSIRRARQLLADALRDSGLGQLAEPESGWYPEGDMHGPPASAHHHLGTTRMHDDPRHGVVDRQCRVHGTETVYIAGGSVFPTGGYANPTLTVVALAIRLADELRRVLAC